MRDLWTKVSTHPWWWVLMVDWLSGTSGSPSSAAAWWLSCLVSWCPSWICISTGHRKKGSCWWHLFKMISFARLLYLLQTIPILLRHKDINLLPWTKLWCPFCVVHWQSSFSRGVRGALVSLTLNVYYLFCLSFGVWLLGCSQYSNFIYETEMVLPYNLSAVLHSNLWPLSKHLQQSLLIWDMVIAWQEIW